MAGRSTQDPRALYRESVRAVMAASQVAHGWDPRATDTRPAAVFRELGRWRWVRVPLAAALFALFVFAVGMLAGAGGPS